MLPLLALLLLPAAAQPLAAPAPLPSAYAPPAAPPALPRPVVLPRGTDALLATHPSLGYDGSGAAEAGARRAARAFRARGLPVIRLDLCGVEGFRPYLPDRWTTRRVCSDGGELRVRVSAPARLFLAGGFDLACSLRTVDDLLRALLAGGPGHAEFVYLSDAVFTYAPGPALSAFPQTRTLEAARRQEGGSPALVRSWRRMLAAQAEERGLRLSARFEPDGDLLEAGDPDAPVFRLTVRFARTDELPRLLRR